MRLVRPRIQRLRAYVPGEQPRISGLIKLNTNENPYPPSPKVLAAVQAAVDGRLRLYPNPTAQLLRERLAKFHQCGPENLIVGNGSDELLAMATRVFVEPMGSGRSEAVSANTIQFFEPSYSLYPVLAAIHGAQANPVRLGAGFEMPAATELARGGRWDFRAALTFVTTPNAPSGRAYPTEDLDALCQAQKGVVLLDEAYVDFAETNALALALKHPNVLVARTFSKAYSLCFQRIGYLVGPADLIAALHRVRDSYNVNGLGQVAARATLRDLAYYRANFRRLIATRQRVSRALAELGCTVVASQTNFLLVKPPGWPAQVWQEKLRARKILVRWFAYPSVRDYLRISIGTDPEMDALLAVVRALR